MTKTTQHALKELVKNGAAIDITNADNRGTIPEPYTQIAYASGLYGCSGMLFVGNNTGKLYAITTRSTAIFIF